MKPFHRESWLSDLNYISLHMRYADKREVEALGSTVERSLALGFGHSTICRTIIDNRGRTVGIFGVTPLDPKVGQVWMLGTDGLVDIKTSFLKNCRDVVKGMNEQYPQLCNLIDSRNEVHLKWIKWCGFKIIGERVINNVKFYEFVRLA